VTARYAFTSLATATDTKAQEHPGVERSDMGAKQWGSDRDIRYGHDMRKEGRNDE
jgi:hypothetical protein